MSGFLNPNAEGESATRPIDQSWAFGQDFWFVDSGGCDSDENTKITASFLNRVKATISNAIAGMGIMPVVQAPGQHDDDALLRCFQAVQISTAPEYD